MINVEIKRETDLSADVVWNEMRHFDRVLRWVPGGNTSRIEISGEGIGMVRDIHLSTQGYVQHQLVDFDDTQRMLSYKLTAGKPVGMQEYKVKATVTPLDENRCLIRWAGQMRADDRVDEIEVGKALETALDNMVTGTIALLKGEPAIFKEQPLEDWQKQHT